MAQIPTRARMAPAVLATAIKMTIAKNIYRIKLTQYTVLKELKDKTLTFPHPWLYFFRFFLDRFCCRGREMMGSAGNARRLARRISGGVESSPPIQNTVTVVV